MGLKSLPVVSSSPDTMCQQAAGTNEAQDPIRRDDQPAGVRSALADSTSHSAAPFDATVIYRARRWQSSDGAVTTKALPATQVCCSAPRQFQLDISNSSVGYPFHRGHASLGALSHAAALAGRRHAGQRRGTRVYDHDRSNLADRASQPDCRCRQITDSSVRPCVQRHRATRRIRIQRRRSGGSHLRLERALRACSRRAAHRNDADRHQ